MAPLFCWEVRLIREPCYKCVFVDRRIDMEPCEYCSNEYFESGDHPAFKAAKPKNYIALFVNENDLSKGQAFKISTSKKLWFYFKEVFSLDIEGNDEYMRMCLDFQSILLGLLTGETFITERR